MLIIILFIIFIILLILYRKSDSNKNNYIDDKPNTDDEIIHTDESTNIIDINYFTDTIPLYFDKPSKLFSIYFPYIDIQYMNSKLRYTSIDSIIQSKDGYENTIYNIITNKKYDKLFNAIFIIKPDYKILYNIFYAYMLNRKNSRLYTDTDIQNKYMIKRLFNDINYLYIVPFTESIHDVQNIPEISNYNMIDTMCKKDNKYIQCKIKITPTPTNFQIIDDMYYNDITKYITILLFIDIIESFQTMEIYNSILKEEKNNANNIKKILEVRVPILF